MWLTLNIGHWADSAKLKMITFNKICRELVVWSLEMPNAPYTKRVR